MDFAHGPPKRVSSKINDNKKGEFNLTKHKLVYDHCNVTNLGDGFRARTPTTGRRPSEWVSSKVSDFLNKKVNKQQIKKLTNNKSKKCAERRGILRDWKSLTGCPPLLSSTLCLISLSLYFVHRSELRVP